MTLIAAYRHRGVPVLIGDMALTTGKERSLRKKIYKICDNFAIGWTGKMIVASKVIPSLKSAFHNQSATKESIENFFKSYAPTDFGSQHTNFIGWVINKESFCFLWNCQYPKELFFAPYFVEGAGQEYFEGLRNQEWQSGGSMLHPEEETVLSLITKIAQARFEESLYHKTWDISFGSSYDILVFLGGRFKYVQSIVYIGWDYYWDSKQGTGRLEQAPIIIKHNCMIEYSILQESMQGKYYTGKTVNYLSRPVYDDMPEVSLSTYPFSLESDYYANYFIFRENEKTIFKLLLTIQKPTGEGPLIIKERGGAYFLDYDTGVLDRLFRKHTL